MMKSQRRIGNESNVELSGMVKVLKGVGEENRVKILRFLQGGEKCVCEIWRHLNITQNLASHHLKVLKDLGLILPEERGARVFYTLNRKAIKKYAKALHEFLSTPSRGKN